MPDIRIPSGSSTAAAAATAARDQAFRSGMGYTGETSPRQSATGTTIMVAGAIYYMGVGLLVGDVVTNLHTVVNTLGSGWAGINMKGAIYKPASATTANQVAITGDISVAHSTTGAKINALTTPYTVTATGQYFFALLTANTTTTPPVLFRNSAATPQSAAALAGSYGMYGISGASKTDFDADPVTIIFAAGAPIHYWVGWS